MFESSISRQRTEAEQNKNISTTLITLQLKIIPFQKCWRRLARIWQWNISSLFIIIEWARRGKELPCVGVFIYNRQERKPDFLNWKNKPFFFWKGQAEKKVHILDVSFSSECIVGIPYNFFTASLHFLSSSKVSLSSLLFCLPTIFFWRLLLVHLLMQCQIFICEEKGLHSGGLLGYCSWKGCNNGAFVRPWLCLD